MVRPGRPTLKAIRGGVDWGPAEPKVMLSNTVGYAWLGFMQHFDGTCVVGGG